MCQFDGCHVARSTAAPRPLAILSMSRCVFMFHSARQRRGLASAVRAFPMQLLYYDYSGAPWLACFLAHLWRRAGRRLQPVYSLEP